MSYTYAIVVMLAWLATLGDARTILIKSEIARLQGTWHVVELTADGQKAPPEEDVHVEYVFHGQNVKVQGEEFSEEALFQLNPEAPVKTIDMVDAKQPGPMTAGIYKLAGDELVLCFAGEGAPRPEDFTNEKGAGRTTFVLRRVNPKQIKDELARLQGTWKFASAELGGQQASAQQLALGKLTIQENRFQVHRSGELVSEGTFTLDLTGMPRRMRLTVKDAQSEPTRFHATYQCDGATLEVMVDVNRDTRPTGAGAVGPKGHAVFKKEAGGKP